MTFYYDLTRKFELPWFPQQKSYEIIELDFGLLPKTISVTNTSLWYLHVLFSKIIFTDEYNFCDFQSVK